MSDTRYLHKWSGVYKYIYKHLALKRDKKISLTSVSLVFIVKFKMINQCLEWKIIPKSSVSLAHLEHLDILNLTLKLCRSRIVVLVIEPFLVWLEK
jgi:hypothetical protein